MLQALPRSLLSSLQQWPTTCWCLSLRRLANNATANEQVFPIAPGGLLHICCTQPGTAVTITNGAEDAVQVSQSRPATVPHFKSEPSGAFLAQLLPGGRIVEVIEMLPADSSSAGPSTAAAAATSGHTPSLSVAMPSRFCGVHVSTDGGSVSVGKVQEADMQLVTRGGGAAVQHCKANHAAINTAREAQQQGPGANMQVGELSASQLQLSSGGGAIAVQRMFGRDVQVLSQGGPISIGALYGVKAHLDSCRGAMSLGHMACSGPAMLESGGASLTVDGLEGNASLISSGGDVKVHLHERFGNVFVDSSGGHVEAWLNPAAAVTLQVAAGGGVDLDPALKVTGEWGPASLKGVTAGSGSSHGMDSPAAALPANGSSGSALFSQPLGSSFNASRLHRSAGEVAQFTAEGQQHTNSSSSSSSGSGCSSSSSSAAVSPSSNSGCCKTAAAAGSQAESIGGACGSVVRQLTINAGGGKVVLRAMGWMDGIRAKMQARVKQHPQ